MVSKGFELGECGLPLGGERDREADELLAGVRSEGVLDDAADRCKSRRESSTNALEIVQNRGIPFCLVRRRPIGNIIPAPIDAGRP